jgi:hypothetical protein
LGRHTTAKVSTAKALRWNASAAKVAIGSEALRRQASAETTSAKVAAAESGIHTAEAASAKTTSAESARTSAAAEATAAKSTSTDASASAEAAAREGDRGNEKKTSEREEESNGHGMDNL